MSEETIITGAGPKIQHVVIEGGGASDGAILDGANSSIKATVKDFANANPLTVHLVDTSGDAVSVGGGTQYTEDAAAAANPVGTAVNLVRQDTPATLVSTDGDNVAQRGTNYGAAYVQLVTSSGSFIDSVGGGTEYTEDAVAAANPVGKALIGVRADTLGALTSADGDNVAARMTDKGELYVKHADAVAVTNAGLTELAAAIDTEVQVDVVGALPAGDNNIGNVDIASIAAGDNNIGNVDVVSSALPTGAATSANQSTQITAEQAIQTAVELIDDSVATLGTTTYTEATTKGLTIGAVRRDADTTLVNTTNEIGPLQMDANGRLKVEAFSGETLPVSVSGVSTLAEQQSQTTHLATIAGDTTDIETAVELIDDTVATLGTTTYSEATTKGLIIGAVRRDADTTLVDTTNEISPLIVDATGKLKVEVFDGGDSHTVDNNGTFAVQATIAAAATSIAKAEDAAHTTADVGVPMLGVRKDTPNTALTDTDGDYSVAAMNKLGSIRVAPMEDDLATAATKHVKKYYTSTGAATDGIVWSPAAGTRWFLTHLSFNVSAACTVTFEDDLAGGDSVVYKGEFAANSGAVLTFPEVPMFSGEDAADLLVTTSAGNIYVTAVGYEI